jgi:hypothetical protein
MWKYKIYQQGKDWCALQAHKEKLIKSLKYEKIIKTWKILKYKTCKLLVDHWAGFGGWVDGCTEMDAYMNEWIGVSKTKNICCL